MLGMERFEDPDVLSVQSPSFTSIKKNRDAHSNVYINFCCEFQIPVKEDSFPEAPEGTGRCTEAMRHFVINFAGVRYDASQVSEFVGILNSIFT